MPVDVVVRDFAMHAAANHVGQRAHRPDVRSFIKPQAIVFRQPNPRRNLLDDGFETAIKPRTWPSTNLMMMQWRGRGRHGHMILFMIVLAGDFPSVQARLAAERSVFGPFLEPSARIVDTETPDRPYSRRAWM